MFHSFDRSHIHYIQSLTDVQGICAATYPVSFGLPSPRQHIQSVTSGIGFLGNPSLIGIRLAPTQLPENTIRVTSFRQFVLRTLRVRLSTGFSRSQPKSPIHALCPYPLPFWSSLLAHVGLSRLTMVTPVRIPTHRYLLAD